MSVTDRNDEALGREYAEMKKEWGQLKTQMASQEKRLKLASEELESKEKYIRKLAKEKKDMSEALTVGKQELENAQKTIELLRTSEARAESAQQELAGLIEKLSSEETKYHQLEDAHIRATSDHVNFSSKATEQMTQMSEELETLRGVEREKVALEESFERVKRELSAQMTMVEDFHQLQRRAETAEKELSTTVQALQEEKSRGGQVLMKATSELKEELSRESIARKDEVEGLNSLLEVVRAERDKLAEDVSLGQMREKVLQQEAQVRRSKELEELKEKKDISDRTAAQVSAEAALLASEKEREQRARAKAETEVSKLAVLVEGMKGSIEVLSMKDEDHKIELIKIERDLEAASSE
jgi:chromosome segregation ATPase